MKQYINICLILMALSVINSAKLDLKDFNKNWFNFKTFDKQLYHINSGLESNDNIIILGYMLINDDLYTDVIMTNIQRNILIFKIFNKEKYTYETKLSFNIFDIPELANITIKYLYTLNITNNNKDKYITILTSNNTLKLLKIFISEDNDKYNLSLVNIANLDAISIGHQPIFFEKAEKSENLIYFMLQNNNSRTIYYIKNFELITVTKKDAFFEQGDGNCKAINESKSINMEHSSSFLDIDGDCHQDLVLEIYDKNTSTRYLEIYLNKKGKFCFINEIKIENSYSLGTFEDFNNDGSIDILFIDYKTSNIVIYQNKIEMKEICQANETYDIPFITENDKIFKQNLNLTDYEDKPNPIATAKIITSGDLYLKGYRDIMFTMYNKVSKHFETLIFINNEYNNSIKFEPIKIDISNYFIKENINSAFFDFGEKGKLGIITNYYNEATSKYEVNSFINYLERDNYFLKSIGFLDMNQNNVLLGLCNQLKKTELNGSTKILVKSQQSNVINNNLSPIYSHFGLGRVNNYIENFSNAVNKEADNVSDWSPIIPNSQLMFYYIGSNKNKPQIDILINPTEAMSFIIITTVIVLLILAVVIMYLHFKEKKEDTKDNTLIL